MSNQSDYYPGHLPTPVMHELTNSESLSHWGLVPKNDTFPATDFQTYPMTPAQAVSTLKAAFQADKSYAWEWHCHVAAAAKEEGATPAIANKIADRFMTAAFGVESRFPGDGKPKKEQTAGEAAFDAISLAIASVQNTK